MEKLQKIWLSFISFSISHIILTFFICMVIGMLIVLIDDYVTSYPERVKRKKKRIDESMAVHRGLSFRSSHYSHKIKFFSPSHSWFDSSDRDGDFESK